MKREPAAAPASSSSYPLRALRGANPIIGLSKAILVLKKAIPVLTKAIPVLTKASQRESDLCN
jgi:hypothetical protein